MLLVLRLAMPFMVAPTPRRSTRCAGVGPTKDLHADRPRHINDVPKVVQHRARRRRNGQNNLLKPRKGFDYLRLNKIKKACRGA